MDTILYKAPELVTLGTIIAIPPSAGNQKRDGSLSNSSESIKDIKISNVKSIPCQGVKKHATYVNHHQPVVSESKAWNSPLGDEDEISPFSSPDKSMLTSDTDMSNKRTQTDGHIASRLRT